MSDDAITTVLVMGCLDDQIQENSIDKTIEMLKQAAKETPSSFLKKIQNVFEVRIDGMIMIALAILAAQANEDFFQKNSNDILTLLRYYEPPKLLQFVELLKSKVFGRGFGSRPQKWVKKVMEDWDVSSMDDFIIRCPKQYYSLIMLVHPRYNGSKSVVIRQFLNKK